MNERLRQALQAAFGYSAGGFLATPPGLDGDPGLGIAGITGAPRPPGQWEAIGSASAPDLPGDELTFVALDDGTIVVDADIPDGSAVPLAVAVEHELAPPYGAAALRKEGDVWVVAATPVRLFDLPSMEGDAFAASRVDGELTLSIDGVTTLAPAELRRVLDRIEGDVAVTADRIDGTTWAAEVWQL